jgi:hypothetical protein
MRVIVEINDLLLLLLLLLLLTVSTANDWGYFYKYYLKILCKFLGNYFTIY